MTRWSVVPLVSVSQVMPDDVIHQPRRGRSANPGTWKPAALSTHVDVCYSVVFIVSAGVSRTCSYGCDADLTSGLAMHTCQVEGCTNKFHHMCFIEACGGKVESLSASYFCLIHHPFGEGKTFFEAETQPPDDPLSPRTSGSRTPDRERLSLLRS